MTAFCSTTNNHEFKDSMDLYCSWLLKELWLLFNFAEELPLSPDSPLLSDCELDFSNDSGIEAEVDELCGGWPEFIFFI